MYICICNAITEKDLERKPELKKLLGNNCGQCMMDDEWENEGGMVLPYIDDNSSREEVDNWKKGMIDKKVKDMQDYKIEIIIRAPFDTVKNGVGRLAREICDRMYLSKGNKDTKVYSYAAEPIDRESDEYKFIRDMDK